MARKTGRIAALSATLAAVGAMSVAATPAWAGPKLRITPTFKNWVVSGSLTAKTFKQTVTLPEGSTFNGKGEIIIEERSGIIGAAGAITGSVFVPPFNATLTIPINEIPTPVSVGIKFTQVGEAEGILQPATGCAGEGLCVTTSVPTKANVAFTVVNILKPTEPTPGWGIELPTHCETSEPITLSLSTKLAVVEVVTRGLHFAGTTTIPSIKCEGLEGAALGIAMTAALSGSENPYSITISPPPPPKE